jgi:plasmid stabilization system protein ParE
MAQKQHLQGVSDKEQRKYEHIKESYQDDGVSTDEAKERAARTVLKQHKDAGHKKG